MDNHQTNPVQFVYSQMPNKWYCSGGKIFEDSFTISDIVEFDQSNIKIIDIIDSKQYHQIEDSSYTSLYNAKIVTTENKEFIIPFVIDLLIDNTQNVFSVKHPIDKTNCVLFNQNELNSEFDGTT